MSWPEAPHDLLAGPRGRRLCWTLAGVYGPQGLKAGVPGWREVMFGTGPASPDQLAAELRDVVAGRYLDAIATLTDESALLGPLTAAVNSAMYWQEPDDVDAVLADDAVSASLAPVAAAVTAAPASRWWASPVDRNRQVYVHFLLAGDRQADGRPALRGAATRLASWRANTASEELVAAAERPADPSAGYSGRWWSAPNMSGLVVTTRPLSGLGAVRLWLVEDNLGWSGARCWSAVPRPAARVYEIRGPGDWESLVTRYPLDVTRSRRHDWWRATGWAGRWLIPDFAGVAADYDAVHLTVGGYLTTAGRALAVGDDRTMLAGWDPDATYWLADVLAGVGGPVRWKISPDDRWSAVSGTDA